LILIKSVCEKDGKCLNQSDLAIQRRSIVKQIRLDTLKRNSAYKQNPKLAEKTVEDTLALIFKAKKAQLRRFGLPKGLVEPADDGLFSGEILLTNEAANQILRQSFQEIPEMANEKEFRSSLSTDQQRNLLWSLPIPFYVSNSISNSTSQLIDDVISKIQNESCVKFVKKSKLSEGESSSVLVFEKLPAYANDIWCSLSTSGHVPSSVVYLNENCSSTLFGEISHSILRVLGMTSEFSRFDRDKYLWIQWDKILPEYFDVFVLDGKSEKTSFGLPFDFSSIANFSPSFGVRNPSDSSIVMKNSTSNVQLGQRTKISCGDFENLKKIYCCPGCVDLHSNCGILSNFGYCQKKSNWFWMKQNCPKSCEICCKDSCSSPQCQKEFCSLRFCGLMCW